MAPPEPVPLAVPGVSGSPGGVLEIFRPFDRSPLGAVCAADAAALETALANAHALARAPADFPSPPRRLDLLEQAARAVAADAESWALGIAAEGGKPLRDARVEVTRAIESLRLCAEALRTEGGREIPMGLNAASTGRWAFTRRGPIGVVLAFSAFNHPLNLVAHQVGPALAAGCPVILKPAETTPLTAFRFLRLLHELGWPAAAVQGVAVRDLALAGRMAADPRVALFSFIGSSAVGWSLRSRLAPGTRCLLEHGGCAPVLVLPDADLDAVVPALLRGAFYHAGQVCVSVQRVYAVGPVARALAGRLAEGAARLRVGDPLLVDTDVGPLIRPAAVERLAAITTDARDLGAEVLRGGDALSPTCFAPTVLWNPPESARACREEVFGPLVSVCPVADLGEAIRRANDSPFAFQAAVFTRDLPSALRAAEELRASAVLVNDPTTFRVDWMPFGGHGLSGLGLGGIPDTFRACCPEKLVVVRP